MAEPLAITCVIGPYFPVPPLIGGAVEKVFVAVCESLAARGHHVTIVSRRYPGLSDDEVANGVRHLRIPSRDKPRGALAYRLFDLVYAARAARRLPRSDITITHSVALPLLLARRRAGRIYVSVGRFPKGQMGFYRRADRLQAVSGAVADAIAAQSPAMAARVAVVPNAIGDRFAAAIDTPRPDPDREILYVGRIAREKGIDLLIRGFARLAARYPGWHLRVVGPWRTDQGGDGPDLLAELKRLAGECDVRFDEPVFDDAALAAIYRRAAIFAYPSLAETGESFGLAPLEAMACGAVPVVSALRCFEDFIVDGVNGVVFDHRGDGEAALADALDGLMADGGRRAAAAGRARATARRFTPAEVAALFEADFQKLRAP